MSNSISNSKKVRRFNVIIETIEDFDSINLFKDIDNTEKEIENVRKALKLLEQLNSKEIEKRLWYYLEELERKKRELYHKLLVISRVKEIKELV